MQKQRKTSNTTTSEIVLESLREQIINGILQPQEKLVEAEIARKFGLSRGPVREALRQLAVEGLVDYCPNKGCTSGSLDPSHVLLAIGLPHEIAHGSLRLTLNEEITKEDIDYVVDQLKTLVSDLRGMSPLYEDFAKKQNK